MILRIENYSQEEKEKVDDHVDIIFITRKFKFWLISTNALGKCNFPDLEKKFRIIREYFSTGHSSVYLTPF